MTTHTTFTLTEMLRIGSDLADIERRATPADGDSVDDLRRDMAHIRATIEQLNDKIFASAA